MFSHLIAYSHQMDTFSALLALCAGNSPVTRSFDAFFDLHLNKRLSKQSRGWWSETPPRIYDGYKHIPFGFQNVSLAPTSKHSAREVVW